MTTLQSTLRVSLLDDVTARSRAIGRSLDALRGHQMTAFAPMRGMIGQAMALGAGYLGVTEGLNATAGAAISFETAFADVRKVVEATDEQFENMRRTIRRMSGEIPLAENDIAALFAAAGESGIATYDLAEFAEMAARVGIAFDMGAGQAGESLAKLKTQLNLTVAETGSMADAINHLSNNMASKAKDITEFMLRVGSFGEMGGFAKEELAAMGSAMIAAGSDASTAGTAMTNVIRALTKGQFAKKSQRDAAKALGLHLPSIAKDMQKDAKGTMRKVLESIAKAPKEQQVSLLSEFFGDEARAFLPLVGNIKLLDDALASVGDRTKFAGSAFREYVERASTTQNVLDLLRNKFTGMFSAMGDDMLPSIREGAVAIGDVVDTLGERVSILDKLETSIKGFAQGLGFDGGARELVEFIGDLVAGPVTADAGDQLGRLFMQAKEWGASIRELNDAVRDNPIAQFFAEMAGYGFQIFLWGAGIGVLAGTIRKLAGALMLLSGASTVIGALKTVGTIAGLAGGASPGAGAVRGVAGTAATSAGAGLAARLLGLTRLGVVGAAGYGGYEFGKAAYTGDTFHSQGKSLLPGPEDMLHAIGSFFKPAVSSDGGNFDASWSKQNDSFLANWQAQHGAGGAQTATALRIDADSIRQIVTPAGTQDVRVTNPEPPVVHVSAPISISGVLDPQAAASAAANDLGEAVRRAVEGSFSD